MRRSAVLIGVATAVVFAGASTASGAVTIGSDMGPAADPDTCGVAGLSCTVLVVTLTGHSFAVPSLPGARGVVVRWRVKEASGQLRLRTVRPGPAGRTVVASSAVV